MGEDMDFYKWGISAITLLLVSACGTTVSCSIPNATAPETCTEFDEGYTSATASAACAAAGGSNYAFSSSATCIATNRVGGCTVNAASKTSITNYYSPTYSASTGQTACTAQGGTWVAN
jgi:hypothetical protein